MTLPRLSIGTPPGLRVTGWTRRGTDEDRSRPVSGLGRSWSVGRQVRSDRDCVRGKTGGWCRDLGGSDFRPRGLNRMCHLPQPQRFGESHGGTRRILVLSCRRTLDS